MGLFGGGNSTTQNLNTYNTRDQRQTVQNGNAINSGGGGVAIYQTPQGAFDVVRSVSNHAIGANADIAGQALDISGSLATQALDTQSGALNRALDSANSSTQLALQTLQAAGQPASQTIGTKLIYLGIPALVLIAIFRGGK